MTEDSNVLGALSQGLKSAPVVGLVSKHELGIDRFLFIMHFMAQVDGVLLGFLQDSTM